MAPTEDKTSRSGAGSSLLMICVMLMLSGLVLAWFLVFDDDKLSERLAQLAQWSQSHQVAAWLLYLGAQMLAVVFLFPGLIFTLLAGYIFGPLSGIAVILCGTSLGASCAFLIARHFFAESTRQQLLEHPRLKALAAGFSVDGWKIVMLTRTVPLFPFKISNYFFGLLSISLPQFFLGTALGIIPLTVTNVCLGAFAGDINSILEGDYQKSAFSYIVPALGIVTGLVTFFLVRKRARAVLDTEGASTER